MHNCSKWTWFKLKVSVENCWSLTDCADTYWVMPLKLFVKIISAPGRTCQSHFIQVFRWAIFPSVFPKVFRIGPNLCWTKTVLHIVPNSEQTMGLISICSFCAVSKLFWIDAKRNQTFCLGQEIWTGTKYFGTFKRTRH